MRNNPMPRKEWERIKALPPNTATMMHVSAQIISVPNPFTLAVERKVAPGMTYNVGRNAAKREARANRSGVTRHA